MLQLFHPLGVQQLRVQVNILLKCFLQLALRWQSRYCALKSVCELVTLLP